MRNLTYLFGCFLAFILPNVAYSTEPVTDNRYEDGVTLTITNKPFNAKAHILGKCGIGKCGAGTCGESICTIDGKIFYGGNGNVPKEEVASLVFEKNGKRIALDVSGMYNPDVNNANIKKYIKLTSWGEDTYEVTGYFSHDDDTYICLWLIMQGKGSIRNYMGGYEGLVSLTTRVQMDHGLDVTTSPEDSNR